MSWFGVPFGAPYAASKGGVVQWTRALATPWAKDNIQVNAVLPGFIDTEQTKQAREQVPTMNERVLSRTPAGRWGVADDLSGIAAFLGSSGSDFITGAVIRSTAAIPRNFESARRPAFASQWATRWIGNRAVLARRR